LVEQFLRSWFYRFSPVGFDFFQRLLYNFSPDHTFLPASTRRSHASGFKSYLPTALIQIIQEMSANATPGVIQEDSVQDAKLCGGFAPHESYSLGGEAR
jgi:hypothetical protein